MSTRTWSGKWGTVALYLLVPALMVCGCKKKPAPTPPPEVKVITLAPTNVPISEEWIGTLEGFVNAVIHAQVTGYLLKQDYAEGSLVKKDDLLFEIDPRPFQAALDQAEAKLAQDRAQLAKTGLDVKRFTPLAKEQAISEETLDDAVQANRADQALVQADQAAVESARLNLGFTRITSPIDGLAGTAQAQIGDLATPSGPALTTVSTISPIRVYFQASEQSYLTFWRRFALSGDTNQNLALQLVLSDGSAYPRPGTVLLCRPAGESDHGHAANRGPVSQPGLHPAPRPIWVGPGADPGPDQRPPGAPARGHGIAGRLPGRGRGRSKQGAPADVKVGNQIGSGWIIEEGLKAGDRVVVEGTQKAKEGKVVNPKPFALGAN